MRGHRAGSAGERCDGKCSSVAGRGDLKRGELTVSYAEDISDEIIKKKIERAGCTLGDL